MKRRETEPHEEVPAGDKAWVDEVLKSALCNPPTIYATYGIARRAIEDRVPGDFVECGVFAGGQAAVMAHVCAGWGVTDRTVHLFDSFCGIPHAGPRDVNNIDGRIFDYGKDDALETTGIAACSMEQVVLNMEKWKVPARLLAYYKGWFQQTVPAARDSIAEKGVAVLRLDGDLYSSTKVCMENLFPLLNPGGYLIVDDWALEGTRNAVKEFMEGFFHDVEWYEDGAFTAIPGGGGPVWWQMPYEEEPSSDDGALGTEDDPKSPAEGKDVSRDLLGYPGPKGYGDV